MGKQRPNVHPDGPNRWRVAWYEPASGGKRVRRFRRIRGDQQTAIRIQAKLQSEAEARAGGLIDPAAEKFAADARQPLSQHIEDFKSVLASRRNTTKHVEETVRSITDTARRCGWKSIADISGPKLSWLLAQLGSKGLSGRTLNKRRMAAKMFSRWLWQEQRLRMDPLANVRLVREADDRRRVRRALSLDECRRLIAATVCGPTRARLEGDLRAGFYRLLLGSGLRVGEAAPLRRADVDFDHTPALIRVNAAYSKRRRTDTQPIPPDTAAALRALTAGLKPGELIWPGLIRRNLTAALGEDLAAARTVWLDEAKNPEDRIARENSDFLRNVDSEGRVVDMHALRHSFVSAVVRGGVSAKVAQTLARHSTPTLTMNIYAHAELDEVCAGMDALPTLDDPVVAARGTFKSAADVPELARGVTRMRGRSRHVESSGVIEAADLAADSPPSEPSANKPLVAPGRRQSVSCNTPAGVAELADAADSKSAAP